MMSDSVRLPTDPLYCNVFLRTLSLPSLGAGSGECFRALLKSESTQPNSLDDSSDRLGMEFEGTCSITT